MFLYSLASSQNLPDLGLLVDLAVEKETGEPDLLEVEDSDCWEVVNHILADLELCIEKGKEVDLWDDRAFDVAEKELHDLGHAWGEDFRGGFWDHLGADISEDVDSHWSVEASNHFARFLEDMSDHREGVRESTLADKVDEAK